MKQKLKLTTISRKKWEEKKKHGYASTASGKWGIPKGTKLILDRDKRGTVLIPVKIRKKG